MKTMIDGDLLGRSRDGCSRGSILASLTTLALLSWFYLFLNIVLLRMMVAYLWSLGYWGERKRSMEVALERVVKWDVQHKFSSIIRCHSFDYSSYSGQYAIQPNIDHFRFVHLRFEAPNSQPHLYDIVHFAPNSHGIWARLVGLIDSNK